MKNLILLCSVILMLVSCNLSSNNNRYDGSYSLIINVFGVNVNQEVDLIIHGNKLKHNGKILNCKQYEDRVEVEEGKIILNAVNGDLIFDTPLGKVRYVRVSGDNNLNKYKT